MTASPRSRPGTGGGAAAFAAAMALVLAWPFVSGCRRKAETEAAPAAAAEGAKAAPEAPDAPTPVKAAAVGRRTLEEVIAGPGHTAALTQQKLRAPFAGTLVELKVSDGDILQRGQAVGTIVARESEAALSGAREMLREAQTAAQRADAERAIALAEKNLVRKPILASASGPVLSHAAASGDRVTEDQEILTIADASSMVFLADVAQNDLPRVRPGQRATADLAGGRPPIAGTVHSILPGANAIDFTGPVRIDLPASAGRLSIGLFGMARIVVGSHPDATVVPDAAILKDDVSGVSRVATIVSGHLRWIQVTSGLREGGMTEVAGAPLAPGSLVLVSGMIGLPEGKAVAVSP